MLLSYMRGEMQTLALTSVFFFFSGLSEASAGYRPPCPDPLRSSVYEAGVSERSSLSHAEPDCVKSGWGGTGVKGGIWMLD